MLKECVEEDVDQLLRRKMNAGERQEETAAEEGARFRRVAV